MPPLKVPQCCFGSERGQNAKVISEDCFHGEWIQPEADLLAFTSNTPDRVTWNISRVHKLGHHVAQVAELLMVASHIGGSSVWNWLCVTLLVP